MLKVRVETLSPSKRRLAIEVPQEQVTAEIDRAFSTLGRRAQVRGFRPGHVPRAVLERRYGDQIRGEVFEKLIRDSYAEAVRTEDINAVSQPKIVTESAEAGQPLRFGATVEVRPEVEAKGYEQLDIERPEAPVTDADVDLYLAGLRESLAQLVPIEDRKVVAQGDVATIDYEGRVAGKVVLRGQDKRCEVGAEQLPEAFESHLIGAEVGQQVEFSVAFPAQERDANIAGKTVEFRVLPKALARKEVPPLDDDFAKDHGECDSLAELRARVRRRLEAAAVRQADEQVRAAAVTQLLAAHDVELPESLVAAQVERLTSEVAERWRAQRIWPQDEAAAFKALRAELKPQARNQVKAALVLDAIAGREGVKVEESEIDAELARAEKGLTDQAHRMPPVSDPAIRRRVAEHLRRERVLDLVLQRARIRVVERTEKHVAGGRETR